MNALISKFAKILPSTTRCVSTCTRPLLSEVKEFKDFEDSELFTPEDGPQHQSNSHEKCMNEVTLIGRVGRDPTLVTSVNREFAKFILATSWYASGGAEKVTDWHEIVVFREALRDYVLKNIGKGDRLFIRGKLNYLRPQEGGNMKDQRARIMLQDIVILRRKKFELEERRRNREETF